MPMIKLKSFDGKIFEVDSEILCCSFMLKEMIDNLGGVSDGDEIPLPNIKSTILEKFIEYATFHKDDPVPDKDDLDITGNYQISSWDSNFLKVDQTTLYELMLAANYLDAKGLLDAACYAVAKILERKTPDEIRKLYGIEDDLTAEEKAAIEKENSWCEDRDK